MIWVKNKNKKEFNVTVEEQQSKSGEDQIRLSERLGLGRQEWEGQNGGGERWKKQGHGNGGTGLMERTKGLTPERKRAVTDRVMKLPPCLLNLGDRERVRDTKWEEEREGERGRERRLVRVSFKASEREWGGVGGENSPVWAQEHLSSWDSRIDNWLCKTNGYGIWRKQAQSKTEERWLEWQSNAAAKTMQETGNVWTSGRVQEMRKERTEDGERKRSRQRGAGIRDEGRGVHAWIDAIREGFLGRGHMAEKIKERLRRKSAACM